jgi:hypothetical protein
MPQAEAQNRLQRTFVQMLRAFATEQSPLVLQIIQILSFFDLAFPIAKFFVVWYDCSITRCYSLMIFNGLTSHHYNYYNHWLQILIFGIVWLLVHSGNVGATFTLASTFPHSHWWRYLWCIVVTIVHLIVMVPNQWTFSMRYPLATSSCLLCH